MNAAGDGMPMYFPVAGAVDDPVLEARRMYARVLGTWASDVLELRRSGRLAPAWRALPDARDGMTWRAAA